MISFRLPCTLVLCAFSSLAACTTREASVANATTRIEEPALAAAPARPVASNGAAVGTLAQATAAKAEPVDLEVTFDLEEAMEVDLEGKPTHVALRSLTTKIRVTPGEPATLSGLSRERESRGPDGAPARTKETLTFKVLPQSLSEAGARVQFLVVREAAGVQTTLAAPVLESPMGEKSVVEQKGDATTDAGGILSLRVSMKPSKPKNL